MAFRAFYALPVENFTTRSGLATNAIHGFLSMLVKLLADEEPTHVAIAFDVGRQTFRTEEYAEYKGTRDALPEDFRDQVPLIRETIRAMGLVEVSKENYEADDVIATLAREATGAGWTSSSSRATATRSSWWMTPSPSSTRSVASRP